MFPVYFLSLLALVYGDLIIDIDVTTDPPFIDVRNFISTDAISDVERATFGIQDAQLKQAVANYTNDNTEPKFVYVKKTGDKNDLYANHGSFEEIKRIVKPKYIDAEIAVESCKKERDVNMRIKTSWKINDNLTIADKIKHIVYYKPDGHTLPIESAWGQDIFQPIPKYGDVVEVCTMSVTIEYETTLAGDVAAAYAKKRASIDGDHYIYAYDVYNVQKAAGLKESVVSTETITVTYPKSVVTSPTTSESSTVTGV